MNLVTDQALQSLHSSVVRVPTGIWEVMGSNSSFSLSHSCIMLKALSFAIHVCLMQRFCFKGWKDTTEL